MKKLFFEHFCDSTMLVQSSSAKGVLLAVHVCLVAAVLFLFTRFDYCPSNYGATSMGLSAARVSTSESHAGVSGRRYQMTPWRKTPSLPAVVGQTTSSNALPSAPLDGPGGQPFPICGTWAVITTINSPSRLVQQLANLTDVCVCVVADEKSVPVYNLTRSDVVYLTPDMQVRIGRASGFA